MTGSSYFVMWLVKSNNFLIQLIRLENIRSQLVSSTRLMFGLDRKTLKYFIEPLSKKQHIKAALIQRFHNFTKMLEKAPKTQLGNLYQLIKNDCKLTSGPNIRRIESLFQGISFKDISRRTIKSKELYPVRKENKWRLQIVEELIDTKHNQLIIDGFTRTQIDEMLADICRT